MGLSLPKITQILEIAELFHLWTVDLCHWDRIKAVFYCLISPNPLLTVLSPPPGLYFMFTVDPTLDVALSRKSTLWLSICKQYKWVVLHLVPRKSAPGGWLALICHTTCIIKAASYRLGLSRSVPRQMLFRIVWIAMYHFLDGMQQISYTHIHCAQFCVKFFSTHLYFWEALSLNFI